MLVATTANHVVLYIADTLHNFIEKIQRPEGDIAINCINPKLFARMLRAGAAALDKLGGKIMDIHNIRNMKETLKELLSTEGDYELWVSVDNDFTDTEEKQIIDDIESELPVIFVHSRHNKMNESVDYCFEVCKR